MATATIDTALLAGKVLSFWEQHTPESSPGPEALRLPDEAKTQDEKSSLLTNLIARINTVDEDPWLTLGVRNSEEFDARAHQVVKVLDKAKENKVDGAEDAFKKAEKANANLDGFFKNSRKWLKRTLDHEGKSYAEVLSLDTQDEDPQKNYDLIKSYLNPKFIKEPGVEEALKVLDNALKNATNAQSGEEDDDMKDADTAFSVDSETLALYQSASPWVFQLFKAVHRSEDKEVPNHIKNGFRDVNDKINSHNRTTLQEGEAEGLQISLHRLRRFAEDASPYLSKLEADPSDEAATKALAHVNKDLLEHNKRNHYPTSWQIHVPGSFDEMLERAPVSTAMDIPDSAGTTLNGGRILRYVNHSSDDEPRYSFLVEIDGRYFFKPGKEVGETAVDSYVKLGTYYGETKYGVKYSRKYFNELRKLEDPSKPSLSFLGAARRSYKTKSGKTLPPEHCVIFIRDRALKREWYEVFSRSAWVKLYSSNAGLRFDKYWKDLGQKPSEKKKDDSETLEDHQDDTAVKTLQNDVSQLRKEVGGLQSLSQTVISLQQSMTEMARTMQQLTNSLQLLDSKTH